MPRALVLSIVFVATTAWGQTAPETPRGDTASGAAIAAGKARCLTCHRIQDTGSRIGPDLTDIGAIRTVEQIQTSLVDPDAEVLPENRVVSRRHARRRDHHGPVCSTTIRFRSCCGIRKAQLRSFTKSELREHGFVAASPMPSYRSTLSGQELTDLVTYLASLKGVVAE